MILPEKHYCTDRRFISSCLSPLPGALATALAQRYGETYQREQPPRYAANSELRLTCDQINRYQVRFWSDDETIKDAAEARARWARRISTLAGRQQFCQAHGIEPPVVDKKIDMHGAYERMACPLWWRMKLRKSHARGMEGVAIDANLVNAKRGIYCSDATLDRRRSQKSRNQQLLKIIEAINEHGQAFTLADLCSRNISNPAVRRAELMARINGFEQVADELVITLGTVKKHISNIYGKLGVNRRTQAVARAQELDLL